MEHRWQHDRPKTLANILFFAEKVAICSTNCLEAELEAERTILK